MVKGLFISTRDRCRANRNREESVDRPSERKKESIILGRRINDGSTATVLFDTPSTFGETDRTRTFVGYALPSYYSYYFVRRELYNFIRATFDFDAS